LSAGSELSRFVLDRNELSKQLVLDNWNTVSEQVDWISQIHFISTSGFELLRTDYDQDFKQSTTTTIGQNKSENSYFTQTKLLSPNQFYISPITLNREYGELSFPITPVIRFATPVFEATGDLDGVLVVNFLVERIIEKINTGLGNAPGITIILDHQGNVIQGYNNEDNWAYELQPASAKSFAEINPLLWQQIAAKQSGVVFQSDERFVYNTFNFDINNHSDNKYIVVQHVAKADIENLYVDQNVKVYSLFLILFILLCTMGRQYYKKKLLLEVEHNSLELISALFYCQEAIFITNASWEISVVNNAFCKATGYTSAEVTNLTCDELYFFSDNNLLSEMTASIDESGQWIGEVQSIRKDGMRMTNMLFASAVQNKRGVVSHYVLQMMDISQRKQMEDELKISAAAFDTRSAITICDKDGKIMRVNQAFTDITGYSQDEVIGKNPSVLSSGEHNKSFYQGLWNDILTAGFWQGEIINRHKDGNTFPEWITISAINDTKGNIINYVATFEDITERKRLETQVANLLS
jgi:PAS domain S-box-containing protein